MNSNKKFYLTTTLPYVNSSPHIGHALEFVRADVLARYKRQNNYDVFLNTGTDEHGAKIFEKAIEEGVEVQAYVDKYAEVFKNLHKALNMSEINFIRTTDSKHIVATQEIWRRCFNNGYIYKKIYKTKYCVGCELEKTDSELLNGKCPIHPNREIEIIDEENYFFRFSALQDRLLEFYKNNEEFVVPNFRYNEIINFVEKGLEDFSISRIKEKMPWGIAIPAGACDKGDEDKHVMYVWFDALTNYISTLDWPEQGNYEKYWKQEGSASREVFQYCGKDNLRQQSAIWQAMLMAANLPNSTKIIINGFINSGGQKMSKSIGNVINPFDVLNIFSEVTDYPEDVLRFVLLHEVPSFEDGDVTIDSIKSSYSSNLQKGLGNLVSRVCAMTVKYNVAEPHPKIPARKQADFDKYMSEYDFKKAIGVLTLWSRELDERIARDEPFKLIRTDEKRAKAIIREIHSELLALVKFMQIFIPRSAETMERYLIASGEVKPIFRGL